MYGVLSKSTESNYSTANHPCRAYADGGPQVGGPEGTEHVTLGAANVNMPIGAANHTQELIGANSAFDGIIGLAFRRPNADGSVPRPTFMEAVQHKLDKPVFTCDLHRSAASSITFGSVDNSKFKGSLTELTVNNKTAASWLVDGVTFSAGGKSLGSAASSVLFDTGGLGTRLSSAQAKAYWAQVNGSQNSASNGYVFPCANKTPDLTFKFKAGPAVVSGATLNPTSNKVSGSSTSEHLTFFPAMLISFQCVLVASKPSQESSMRVTRSSIPSSPYSTRPSRLYRSHHTPDSIA